MRRLLSRISSATVLFNMLAFAYGFSNENGKHYLSVNISSTAYRGRVGVFLLFLHFHSSLSSLYLSFISSTISSISFLPSLRDDTKWLVKLQHNHSIYPQLSIMCQNIFTACQWYQWRNSASENLIFKLKFVSIEYLPVHSMIAYYRTTRKIFGSKRPGTGKYLRSNPSIYVTPCDVILRIFLEID